MIDEPKTEKRAARRGKEIADELKRRTIAFAAYAEKPAVGSRPSSTGSAVPIQIAGRCFLLTAGHCVDGLAKAPFVALIIKHEAHMFTPKFGRGRAVHSPGGARDFGYVEVEPADARTIESAEKIFTGPSRIRVCTREELAVPKRRAVVAGYPRATAADEPRRYGARFLHVDAPVATPTLVPKSPLPSSAPIQSIDLWMSRDKAVDGLKADEPPTTVPPLSGVSGGGVWFPGQPLEEGAAWSPEEMSLVGVHVGSAPEVVHDDGGRHLFTRVILVGQHLKIIADDHAELRQDMLARWPLLATFVEG